MQANVAGNAVEYRDAPDRLPARSGERRDRFWIVPAKIWLSHNATAPLLAEVAADIPTVTTKITIVMQALEQNNFTALSALSPVPTAGLTKCTFSSRDWIPARPGFLWRIERGAVRTLTWNPQGTPITLGLWGPGDVVGTPLTRLDPYKIECLTRVELSLVPSQRWEEMFHALLAHAQQSEELMGIVRCDRVPIRLHQFLVWLAGKFGTRVEKGRRIDLRLTHQEIAEFIGTSRVTVTRLLKLFEQEGAIARQGRHFILLERAA